MRSWLLLGLLGLAQAADPVGWRYGGSAVLSQARPPKVWSADKAIWKTALPGGGHASPVPFGDLLCVLGEPDAVVCLQRSTGQVRWKDNLPVESVLTGEARARYLRSKAEAAALQVELSAAQRTHAELLRQARRAAGDPAVLRAVQEGSARLDALKARLDGLEAQGPETVPEIGLAAATSVSDGQTLVSLLGSGVLAAHTLDGARRWAVHLTAGPTEMRGYRAGRTASPLWVDDVLIVAYGALRGISARTGQVLWTAGTYRDYGTPAVARVGGLAVVLTPDGQVLRASDGEPIAEGLGDLWYQGPHVDGDVVYYVGGTGYGPGDGPVRARAWRLVAAGERVRTVLLWERELPTKERIYATPVSHGGRLIVVGAEGALIALDQLSGQVVHSSRVEVPIPGKVYRSPVVAGGTLFVGFEHGLVVGMDVGTLGGREVSLLPRGLGTPWFEGERVFVRTEEGVWCL
jgi:outer membrane protein assembly factor BamB